MTEQVGFLPASPHSAASISDNEWIGSPGLNFRRSPDATAETHGLGPAAPFVYAPVVSDHRAFWSPTSASSVQVSSSGQPQASEASLHVSDSWINTLAPWTQAGTATVLPQGSAFDGYGLAANGIDTMTHGGWTR
ncbi:hypothetical protein [Labrys miyagiensis]|uniref:hypothetical protein n=1 Tax=Labrys miyagiensis TaxID=346912 RepID=UPI0024E062E9|nr:hypothetical protein [Labrys miyagiensis]